jgi:hypothetical protein
MSYNHPLWAAGHRGRQKDARRFAPTAAARSAKAPAGKERDLIEAIDVYRARGDKHACAMAAVSGDEAPA